MPKILRYAAAIGLAAAAGWVISAHLPGDPRRIPPELCCGPTPDMLTAAR